MSVYRHKRKLSARFITRTLVLSLLPSVAGLTVLYMSVNAQLSDQLNSEIERSFEHVENIFHISDNVARKSVIFDNKSCELILPELVHEATRQLYIRSINLISENKIYCSSIMATNRELQQLSSEIQDVSTLVPGNTLTPNSPVLYIRHQNIVIGIDGRLLTSFIQGASSGTELQFIIDNRELFKSGLVYPVNASFSGNEKHSEQWGFSIRGQSEPGAQWSIIRQNYWPVVLFFILATVVTFFLLMRRFYSGELTVEDIKTAVVCGEFIPYAQPIFDHTGENILGVEILARWKNPDGEIISPDLFIPLAEQSGVILDLTRSLMQQTGEAFTDVLSLMPPGFHVAFNISNQCCKTGKLHGMCQDFIKITQNKIDLTLELTERESYRENETLLALIRELRQNGAKLAIDDFGTAGSNLDYLSKIDFDLIKIDRSYVAGIGTSVSSGHIIDNILDLARRMNMEVVAEGVEDARQAAYLHTRGVQYFQGYLYSAPLPLDILINKYVRPLF